MTSMISHERNNKMNKSFRTTERKGCGLNNMRLRLSHELIDRIMDWHR